MTYPMYITDFYKIEIKPVIDDKIFRVILSRDVCLFRKQFAWDEDKRQVLVYGETLL